MGFALTGVAALVESRVPTGYQQLRLASLPDTFTCAAGWRSCVSRLSRRGLRHVWTLRSHFNFNTVLPCSERLPTLVLRVVSVIRMCVSGVFWVIV